MKWGIGLDLGYHSIGWTTVALDDDDKPYRFLERQTLITNIATESKSEAPTNVKCRTYRGSRRKKRRRQSRHRRLDNQTLKSGLLTKTELNDVETNKRQVDIFKLRVDFLKNFQYRTLSIASLVFS